MGQYERLLVAPVGGCIGAEIAGVDLRDELPDEVVAEIRRAWLDHLVVFFRDQPLTPEQFSAFARRIGTPGRYPFVPGLPDHPEIIEVKKLPRETVNFGGIWHTDTAYLPRPPMASMLLALTVPPAGGDTEFANMYAAYEALSDGMKGFLGGLRAVNSSALADVSKTREDRIADATAAGHQASESYESVHPVVPHPSRDRPTVAVRERGPHRPLRGHDRGREPAHFAALVRPPESVGVHLPVSLGGGVAGPVGQPLRPAQPRQRATTATSASCTASPSRATSPVSSAGSA